MKPLAPMILFSLLLFSPAWARADARGQRLLRKVDVRVNAYKAVYARWTLTVKHAGSKSRLKYATWNRSDAKRLIKMTYPGDIKGMHILMQSKDVMYIYLPAFRKVRRIAGHVRNQGFMGSGFNYDDMSITRWAPYYSARYLRKTSKVHWLYLRLKPGKHLVYKRIKMAVRKDLYMHTIKYINRRGKVQKTQYFRNYKCDKAVGHCFPTTISMIEHTRGNLVSEMRCTKLRYRSSFRDRMFTVRHLLRSAN